MRGNRQWGISAFASSVVQDLFPQCWVRLVQAKPCMSGKFPFRVTPKSRDFSNLQAVLYEVQSDFWQNWSSDLQLGRSSDLSSVVWLDLEHRQQLPNGIERRF